jgi:colanic acid/amylovoran biosynthesis glycosyltransferase
VKLAYLTTIYPKTSHSFIRREIRELERRGHEVLRIAIREPDEELVHLDDQVEKGKTLYCVSQGVLRLACSLVVESLRQPAAVAAALVAALELSRASDRGLGRHLAYVAEAAWLRTALRRLDIEHLHVHFGTNPAAVALLLRHLGGPTYSFVIHGPDEWDAPIGFGLKQKIELAEFVVVISSFGYAQARRWIDVEQCRKLMIVRTGAPYAALELATPIAPDSKTFLFVGRLCAQKAPLFLIDAMAQLVKRDPDVRLILIGDGELRDAVENRIRERNLEGAVEMTGALAEPDVFERIRASRCVVLPSFAEGLPVVLIEAFALERPVISTYVAAIPELVIAGGSGWLVTAGDLSGLIDAMWQVLRTPSEELDAMGRLGAATIRKRHDLATEVDRLEQALVSRSAKFDDSHGVQRRISANEETAN